MRFRLHRRALLGGFVATSLYLSLALAFPRFSHACGWDQDTVWVDATYMKDILAVMMGRFPRNPPLYYEMRLERVKKELAARPTNLAAYDDAAVASDRLGRPEEAIALLDRKKTQIDALADSDANKKEHLYRYLSNQGTVYYHRWLKNGGLRKDQKDLADVQKAKDLLAEALRVNPQAHFGREKYQVLAMDFILKPKKELISVEVQNAESEDPDALKMVPGFIKDLTKEDETLIKKYPDAARGLAGLVALGASWENVDVFHNLALVLRLLHGKVALSAMASLRVAELLVQGKKSLYVSAAPTGGLGFPLNTYHFEPRNFKEIQRLFGPITKQQYKEMKGKSNIEKEYHLLRQEAEAWNSARTTFMMAQLQAGKHPDTHLDFWNDFKEPELPFLSRAKADPKLNLLLDFDGEQPGAKSENPSKK